MGPRAGLDGCGKSRPPPGFDPRTVQPVGSRYTDWAIAAQTFIGSGLLFSLIGVGDPAFRFAALMSRGYESGIFFSSKTICR